MTRAKTFLGLCAAAFVCGVFLGFCNPVHAGPGPIPFYPTFVSGSGSTGCTPVNQLCFNTTASPYTSYVWNPGLALWKQYGGSGGGSGCTGGAGDFLFTSSGSNCVGANLVWDGSQIVWSANGRVDNPGDIITSGGFDITIGGGGNINYTGGLDISTGGILDLTGTNITISTAGSFGLTGSPISLNGSVIGPFATATATSATAALNLFSSSLQGLTPASGGGTSNFLRADGTWAAPGGGGSITWPASGSAVISNTTNSPAGVAEIDGKVLVGASGAWIAGNVPVASINGGLCVSTGGAIQYNNSGAFGCAPAIINGGVWDFTSTILEVQNLPFFAFPLGLSGVPYTSIGIGNNALAGMASGTGTGDTALGWNACANITNTSSNNTCIGVGAGQNLNGTFSNNITLLGSGVGGNDSCNVPSCDHNLLLGVDGNCELSADDTSNEFDICAGTGTVPLMRGSLNASTLAVKINGTVATAGYTVSGLPSSAPQAVVGARAYVTDALACTFLATLTGGGSAFCPVVYNGSAWIAG
jgi:hypothetical protein